MAKVAWPGPDRRKHIGARISRLDGPAKTTGAAKYAYDMNLEGMLYAKIYQSPHALAKVTGVDTSAAEAMPGVKGVYIEKDRRGELPEITYAGDLICAIAATSEVRPKICGMSTFKLAMICSRATGGRETNQWLPRVPFSSPVQARKAMERAGRTSDLARARAISMMLAVPRALSQAPL